MAGESSAVQARVPGDDARPATGAEASVAVAGVESFAAASRTTDETGDAATGRTPGSGREAGATRDASAGTAGSRALQGTLAVQRREVVRPGEDSARQADMEQAGLYDGDASASGEAAALSGAAAARPPAARRAVELTPAEAAFAAAWAETARSIRTQPR
jgi:hypothetical protein